MNYKFNWYEVAQYVLYCSRQKPYLIAVHVYRSITHAIFKEMLQQVIGSSKMYNLSPRCMEVISSDLNLLESDGSAVVFQYGSIEEVFGGNEGTHFASATPGTDPCGCTWNCYVTLRSTSTVLKQVIVVSQEYWTCSSSFICSVFLAASQNVP